MSTHTRPVRSRVCPFAFIRWIGLAVPFIITAQTGIRGQPTVVSSTMAEYTGLATRQNPDAYTYKPLPVTLSDEADFRVFMYPTRNPLLLKLLIGNPKSRKWVLKIETDRAELLHYETRRTQWDWQLLNVEELPEGHYRLTLTSGPHHVVRPFSIVSPRLVELKAGRTILF